MQILSRKQENIKNQLPAQEEQEHLISIKLKSKILDDKKTPN